MGNYKLFNNRFVSVRSLCNQSNVQLNFVRLAKWEISFGEFCYIQMAFVRWTGIHLKAPGNSDGQTPNASRSGFLVLCRHKGAHQRLLLSVSVVLNPNVIVEV